MKLGFALEYNLGHVSHAENLKRVLAADGAVEPVYIDLPFEGMNAPWTKLPGFRSNWSLRASTGAYLGLSPHKGNLDAALFHTQVTSLLSAGFMRSVPSIVSLDATPLQYDSLGDFYGHAPSSNRGLEKFKKRMNERAFHAAQHLVTWSQWAKDSLVADYGVTSGKITVIPPGIDTAKWDFAKRRKSAPAQPVRLLFVGGHFERKGGEDLLSAMRLLPHDYPVQLDIVTRLAPEIPESRAIHVHTGLKPNSDPLIELYAKAHIFVFPTLGDCLPLAVMEALAAGLPVITTTVGALPEAVTHGKTGLVVPANDSCALAAAICRLVENPEERAAMSKAARAKALESFDADTNYRRLVDLLKSIGAKGGANGFSREVGA